MTGDDAQTVCAACTRATNVCQRCGRSCCNRHYTLAAALAEGAPVSVAALVSGRPGGTTGGGEPEFVAYLLGGLAERYPIPTELAGEPMRGGAAEAYRAAWIAGTHVCVFCRSSVAQESALRYQQEFEREAALVAAQQAREAEVAAALRAEEEQRAAAEEARVRAVHAAHLAKLPDGVPAEAELRRRRDAIMNEARAVRTRSRNAQHDRNRLRSVPFLLDLAVSTAWRAIVLQLAAVVLLAIVLPGGTGWQLLGLALMAVALAPFLAATVRRRVRHRVEVAGVGELGGSSPTPVVLGLTALTLFVAGAVTARVLLSDVDTGVATALVLVLDLLLAFAAVLPAASRQAELDAVIAQERPAVDHLRAQRDEVEGFLAHYRCGEPNCPFDDRGS